MILCNRLEDRCDGVDGGNVDEEAVDVGAVATGARAEKVRVRGGFAERHGASINQLAS
jgi:hypothetical protein